MAAKSKVHFELLCGGAGGFTIVYPASRALCGISSTSLISVFHSLFAHFLLFSLQPHINGWKVGVPFRKNGFSSSKSETKADGQVSSITCETHTGCNVHIKSCVL